MAFKSTTSSTTYANAKAAKDAQVEGGTVAQAGNIDTDAGVIKNDQSLINMNAADDSEATGPGSQVVANDGTGNQYTDRAGVQKANTGSTGAIAYNANNDPDNGTTWVMMGGNVTQKLAGDAFTDLIGGAGATEHAGKRRPRTKVSDKEFGVYVSGDINVLAPVDSGIHSYRTKAANAGDALAFTNPSDGSAAVASEIEGTRSIPGRLTFMYGNPVASGAQYKAKDAFEVDGF